MFDIKEVWLQEIWEPVTFSVTDIQPALYLIWEQRVLDIFSENHNDVRHIEEIVTI